MNIYIDGTFFRLSGIGRIYENVMGALLESDVVEKVCTVVPVSRRREFLNRFSSSKLDARFVNYENITWRDFTVKALDIGKFSPRPDIYYFPNYYFPFGLRGKIVVNINDIIPIYPLFDIPGWKKAIVRFLISRSIKISRRCVCISRFTRDDVLREFHCKPDRLAVIYPWIDDKYLDYDRNMSADEPRIVGADYILFVGNRFIHKNLAALLAAFHMVLDDFPELKLVVAGKKVRKRDDVDICREKYGLQEHVIEMEALNDSQVMNLYRHSSVFVFPSFIEGFGLPPLEALAFRRHVVCSDIPVLREVCGDSVRYADPRDPAALAREIRNALTAPPKTDSLSERDRERIHIYRKEKSLSQFMDLFSGLS